jgi:hypothetical protein
MSLPKKGESLLSQKSSGFLTLKRKTGCIVPLKNRSRGGSTLLRILPNHTGALLDEK